jgi:hypothetical protein
MNDFFQMVMDEAKTANLNTSDLVTLTNLLQIEIKKQVREKQEKQVKELKSNLHDTIKAIQNAGFSFSLQNEDNYEYMCFLSPDQDFSIDICN